MRMYSPYGRFGKKCKKISTYVMYVDINYLYYLILFRKDLSTSLCVKNSKSGSGTLFVPCRVVFARRDLNNDAGTIGDFVFKVVFAQVNVPKVLGHVSMIRSVDTSRIVFFDDCGSLCPSHVV